MARNSKGLFLCQRKYALDIIEEMGLLGAKPSNTPMMQNHQLARSRGALMGDPGRYQRLIGRLIYLTIIRPELTYSVHTLAQFMAQPTIDHWDAAVQVVQYLKARPGQGILVHAGCDLNVYAYCDSDWTVVP